MATSAGDAKSFRAYVDMIIDEFKKGTRSARYLGTGAPKEVVDHVESFEVETKTKGIMKLLENYPYGDPKTNGMNHSVTQAKWKDGTVRWVVLMPSTAEDEMEAAWKNAQGYKHRTRLDDGELSATQDQQTNLYKDMRNEKGICQLKGQSVSPSLTLPSQAIDTTAANEAALLPGDNTEDKVRDASDDEDMEDEEEEVCAGNMLDLLMGGGGLGLGAGEAGVAGSASAFGGGGARGSRGSAVPKSAAKAKVKLHAIQRNMPPPLTRGGSGASASPSGRRVQVVVVPSARVAPESTNKTDSEVQALVAKSVRICEDFAQFQKETLVKTCEKNWYNKN